AQVAWRRRSASGTYSAFKASPSNAGDGWESSNTMRSMGQPRQQGKIDRATWFAALPLSILVHVVVIGGLVIWYVMSPNSHPRPSMTGRGGGSAQGTAAGNANEDL